MTNSIGRTNVGQNKNTMCVYIVGDPQGNLVPTSDNIYTFDLHVYGHDGMVGDGRGRWSTHLHRWRGDCTSGRLIPPPVCGETAVQLPGGKDGMAIIPWGDVRWSEASQSVRLLRRSWLAHA
jgi:hypothetical protein